MNTGISKSNNIAIFCQYAQEPPYNTMLRYHNWGKELVKRGYSVTIVSASVVHNTDVDLIELTGKSESTVAGIKYIYLRTPKYTGNSVKRIVNMYKYCSEIRKLKKTLSPDVCIVCEAYVFKYVKKTFKCIPIITDIVDLWPLSIVEYAKKSPKNPLIKYLYHVEKNAYLKSDAVIFSMEGGIDYIKERKYSDKINQSKVFHINMGIDLSLFDTNLKSNISHLSWDTSKFNIGYCGSIRQANNVKQICDAALRLKSKGFDEIQFQIYGNGDELEILKKYCVDNNISNVHFYGRIEREKTPYILSQMKANILTYKQVGLMKYGGSQSKLFDYLAAGRPIICNAIFGHNLITRHNCGLVTESQNVDSFVATIERLYSLDDQDVNVMGENARKTAELYDQPLLVDKLEQVFKFVGIGI